MRGLPVAAATVIVVCLAAGRGSAVSQDQPPSAEDLAEGQRLFMSKANCRACHGWAGDAKNTDSEAPVGANLRALQYPRDLIVTIIKCGKPGSQMPAFDKFAYSDGRCYGKTEADLRALPTRMPDPPSTLQPREVELVADFLMARVIGKGPMTHPACVEFWGSEVDLCKVIP